MVSQRRSYRASLPCPATKDRSKLRFGTGKHMDKLSLQNPVFATYAIAATIMILKAVSMSWLTVVRMTQEKGGFRSPEDIRNSIPSPIRSSSSRTNRPGRQQFPAGVTRCYAAFGLSVGVAVPDRSSSPLRCAFVIRWPIWPSGPRRE